MPDVRGRGVGDLNVHVHVEVPKKLSPRAEELLRELAQEEQAGCKPQKIEFSHPTGRILYTREWRRRTG